MKKGCLGCLGGGCLLIIIAVVVGGYMAYNWCNTEGRNLVCDGLHYVANEVCKVALEEDTAKEIASMTKDLNEEIKAGKISVIDCFAYAAGENASNSMKLQSELLFAVMYRKLKGNISGGDAPDLLDNDGAEAVRTLMYAITQNNIDSQEVSQHVRFLVDEKNRQRRNNPVQIGEMKHGVTKEEMEKAVRAVKFYIQEKKLEAPSDEVSVDKMVKEELVKFINGLRSLKKAGK